MNFQTTLAVLLASGAALWMLVELVISGQRRAASFGKKLYVILFVTMVTWFTIFGVAYVVASLLVDLSKGR